MRERLLNSYILEELDGTPKPGEFNARRLRGFTPREGTELARQQEEVEERLATEEEELEVTAVPEEPTPQLEGAGDVEWGSVEGWNNDIKAEGDLEIGLTSIADWVVGRR